MDEGGASVYSISDEAQNELPDLDVTLRGAGENEGGVCFCVPLYPLLHFSC